VSVPVAIVFSLLLVISVTNFLFGISLSDSTRDSYPVVSTARTFDGLIQKRTVAPSVMKNFLLLFKPIVVFVYPGLLLSSVIVFHMAVVESPMVVVYVFMPFVILIISRLSVLLMSKN
jgi:hypothetical protein